MSFDFRPKYHPSLRRGTGRGGKGDTAIRGSHQSMSANTSTSVTSRPLLKRPHSDMVEAGRGRGGIQHGHAGPASSTYGQHQSMSMDTGEPAAKVQAGASQVHSNLRHIRTVEQPSRGARGMASSSRVLGNTTMNQRGGYQPRGSHNPGATSRPPVTSRPPFQVSHKPAPALTTLVGGGAENNTSRSSHPSVNRGVAAASSIGRPAPHTSYNYGNQEQGQVSQVRPPPTRYAPVPRPQTQTYQQPVAAAPVTHQLPPPTHHYQQNQAIPVAVSSYPSTSYPQQTYAPYQQRNPATAPYAQAPIPSASYAPPAVQRSYPANVTPVGQYPAPVPVHAPPRAAPSTAVHAPRSAKAMITNLPPNATFGRISSMTETCGTVRTINVRSENNSAIIEFVHPESVDAFIRSYHQQMFDHVMINVYRVV